MVVANLVDQYGRPFTEAVTRKEAPARVFDIQRHGWQKRVASGLTPQKLGQILTAADRGDNEDLLSLAIEMPERDSTLHHLLQVRTFAIASAPVRAEASKKYRKDKTAAKIADAFAEEVLEKPNFRWLLVDLMDALMASYAVVHPVWDTTTKPWTFKEFQFIDPRAFQFDKKTLRELRLRNEFTEDGDELPPGRYLVHYPRIRAGLKLRGGLARLAAITWLFKTSTVADWLAFAEVYGMPIRVGKYNPLCTSDDEKATLHAALVNLGHDAAAMIPDSMKIEFVDARRPPSGDNLYNGLATYFDEQMSKAVLGHVISQTSGGAGQGPALAEDRREVRQDLREADAQAICATVQELAKWWTGFNYGPNAPVPEVIVDVEPRANIKEFTAAVLPWITEGGLKVPKKWLLKQLQIPEAEDGEEMFEAPLLPGATAPGSGGSAGSALDGAKRGSPKPKAWFGGDAE